MLRAPMKERIGIVGSGAIATGIARAATEHGDVVLWARSEESASRARDKVEADVYTDLEALSDRTLVIEAVVEDHDVEDRRSTRGSRSPRTRCSRRRPRRSR